MAGSDDGMTAAPAASITAAWQRELLAPFLTALPITGLSISVTGFRGQESTLSESDSVAATLSELQFARGQGPHWKALQTGRPVMVPDVPASAAEWPLFSEALVTLPVGALFSFPLRIGAVTVGVVDLYSREARALDERQVLRATGLAQATTATAVFRATQSADDDDARALSPAPETRREVQQAVGMILAQLDISATDAFYRLQMHAFSTGRSIQSVAVDVISRSVDFRELE